ncbi:hypothetical protein UY3_01362 [Chelonia mydas]|uniref:Uncharacterized protein n=1 Tax=Chelonia mydas TaxID=8469 RepID=M7CK22_CHEMY|nr:hypothetical protein UY3_01362 [Chelonia mydas]
MCLSLEFPETAASGLGTMLPGATLPVKGELRWKPLIRVMDPPPEMDANSLDTHDLFGPGVAEINDTPAWIFSKRSGDAAQPVAQPKTFGSKQP